MAVYKADILDIELNTGNIARSFLCHNIGKDDTKADRFGVRVYRDGEPESLSGCSIQGYMMRPNGTNLAITGSNTGVSGNEAWVDLPQAAYDYEGQFCLALKLIGGGVTGTIRIIDGMINNTFVSDAVAPTAAVPTYQEILSVYDQMVAAKAGSVRFDTDQSLTAAQKTQARGNIEAASESDVADLKSAITNNSEAKKTKILFGWQSGGPNNNTGGTTNSNKRGRTSFYKLNKGARYTIKTGYEFVAYEYDLSGSSASYVGVKINAYTTEYTATDNAAVCFVARNTSDTTISDLTDIEMYIDYEPINDMYGFVRDGIAEDITGEIVGNTVLVGSSATQSSNSNYSTTDFISVSPGDILLISAVCGGNVSSNNYTGLYGYDNSKTLVGSIVNPQTAYGWMSFGVIPSQFATYDNFKCVVPSGVAFVRLSSRVSASQYTSKPIIYRLSTGKEFKKLNEEIGKEFKKLNEEIGSESQVGGFVSGSLNDSGSETTSTTRLRSGFIDLEGKTIYVKANGQKVAFCLYDGSKTFLLNSGWKNSDFIVKQIKTAMFVRFVVAKEDDATIVPGDLTASISVLDGLVESTENKEATAVGFTKTPYTETVEMVMHRGYNSIAPENTIPAFKLARQMGFGTIETDIQLTSDGIPVILHDKTINRTSNGTGDVYSKTLDELKELDFGSWKSPMWAGTEIPTFEEMLVCCKKIGLNVYIEIKKESPWTQELITNCVNIVRKTGMTKNVSWISFSSTVLGYVRTADETARLGYLMTTYTNAAVDTCVSLRTSKNEVMAVTRYDLLSSSVLEYMISNGVPLGAYLFDKNSDADAMQDYVTMALTNEFNAMEYIYSKNIGFGSST